MMSDELWVPVAIARKAASLNEDGSHWYDSEGKPVHEVPLKTKSGTRSTTIRDAKTLNLSPSVTNVMGILKNKSIDDWSNNLLTKETFLSPSLKDLSGEEYDDYKRRIYHAVSKKKKEAPEFGSTFHNYMECWAKSTLKGVDSKFKPLVEGTIDFINNEGLKIVWAEFNLKPKLTGIGGQIDLIAWSERLQKYVIADYKTIKTLKKDGTPVTKWKPFESHTRQISRYKKGLIQMFGEKYQNALCLIIGVSKDEPGRVVPYYLSQDEEEKALREFEAIYGCWKAIKNYYPNVEEK